MFCSKPVQFRALNTLHYISPCSIFVLLPGVLGMRTSTYLAKFLPMDKGLRYAFLLSIATLSMMMLFIIWPNGVEWLFLRSLFQVWRVLYDYTFGLLPIPSGVWLLMLGFWLVYRTWKRKSRSLMGLVKVILWIFNAFFWLWGFLYFMPPACPEAQYHWTNEEMYQWLMEVQADLETNMIAKEPVVEEFEIRERLENFLEERNWPTTGRVRARAWHEGGLSRYLGVSGIYLPWCMEGHLSVTLPAEVLPFVRAHEMSHGYGIAQEGEADYHAYKALTTKMNSNSDQVCRWIGQYELWCTLRRILLQMDPEAFKKSDELCSQTLAERHQLVKANYAKYSGQLADFGAKSNAVYLQAMGMNDGLANYDRWVTWVWLEHLQE
jgi:hypothetical protein